MPIHVSAMDVDSDASVAEAVSAVEEADGIQLYYEMHGGGEPLVPLHGGLGHAFINAHWDANPLGVEFESARGPSEPAGGR